MYDDKTMFELFVLNPPTISHPQVVNVVVEPFIFW
jgi:hypothetical protein